MNYICDAFVVAFLSLCRISLLKRTLSVTVLSPVRSCSLECLYMSSVDYAMYQRCFRRLRTRSNDCYADFRLYADDLVDTISLPSNAVSGFRLQLAIHAYCR